MKETDIFLQLIDEDGINELLSKFNDNSKSGSLSFKKLKLKKIFNNLNAKSKKQKNNMSPFNFAILSYQISKFKNLSEREFFLIMGHKSTDDLPDYKKFANSIIYFPDKVKELLPRIEENMINNKPIFSIAVQLDTQENVIKYLQSTSEFYSEDFTEELLEYIKSYIVDNEETLNYWCKKTIDWNIKDLYEFMIDIDESINNNPQLVQYAYVKSHPEEKLSIKYGLLMELFTDILQTFTNKITEYDKLKHKVVSLENEFNQINTYKQQIKDITDENKELLKEFNQLKKVESNYNKKIELLEKEFNNKISDYKDKIHQLEIQNKNINKEKEKAIKKLNNIDMYLEEVFDLESDEFLYEFVIIHSCEVKIAKKIFREVLFISCKELDKDLYMTKLKSISNIYIQRYGISTLVINNIQQFGKDNNIQCNLILARNEKELIEKIALLKHTI